MAKARYTRTYRRRGDRPNRPSLFAILLNYLTYFLLIGMCLTAILVAWPVIQARFALPAGLPALALPTAMVAAPRPTAWPSMPPYTSGNASGRDTADSAPPLTWATAEAQSLAEYQTAVAGMDMSAAQPVQNMGQGEEAVIEQRDVPERLPAGENVPTAEPIQEAPADAAFGEKAIPVNIQETHQCLHGQVWVDGKGCQNP